MASWSELKKNFFDLEPAFRFARLDRASNKTGDHWAVKGVSDPVARSCFETLATMAGRKLAASFASSSLPDELREAPNDQYRWYRFLCRHHFYEQMPYYGDDGEHLWFYGSVNNPAAASTACCLEVAAMCPDDEKPVGQMTVNFFGPNSRLNFNSIDSSTNIVDASKTEIFEGIRKLIAEHTAASDQQELLNKLRMLEATVKTPSYSDRHKEFRAGCKLYEMDKVL